MVGIKARGRFVDISHYIIITDARFGAHSAQDRAVIQVLAVIVPPAFNLIRFLCRPVGLIITPPIKKSDVDVRAGGGGRPGIDYFNRPIRVGDRAPAVLQRRCN